MGNINYDYATPVIRTDFTDEAIWRKIKKDIAATNSMGFSANVRFIDEKQYNGLTGQELLQRIPGLNEYSCVFVADTTTMSTLEHHLLVLDPSNPEGKTFRVIPSEAWGVENNLSIANMDYSEFADSADPDCVYRGFK
jgi:FKBP-type peptidyl-prolyl cis-trans isomerase 2